MAIGKVLDVCSSSKDTIFHLLFEVCQLPIANVIAVIAAALAHVPRQGRHEEDPQVFEGR
jgi:hypothetical protein